MNAKTNLISPPGTAKDRTPKSIEAAVAAHPFLKDLSPHQYRMLTDLAMVCHFAPGELIFREGDPANRFYLINSGKVALESYLRNGGSLTIQTIGSGELLGWSWMFPPYYWHFDARALEPTDAICFYGTPLRTVCEADHDLGYELLKRISEVMIQRLQGTRRQLLEVHRER